MADPVTGASSPPDDINGLRLFESPQEGERGRIVYQGDERPNFAAPHSTAHEYWIIEKHAPREWNLVQTIATFIRGEGFDRKHERLVGQFRTNEKAVRNIHRHLDEAVGNTVREHFDDGSIRLEPPFTKEEADYRSVNDPDFDRDHDTCGTCVHYVPGRGCHFVQGEIRPEDYCTEFYADYGVFAHEHEGDVEVNAELVGHSWNYDDAAIADFVDEIEERLHQRQREGDNPNADNPDDENPDSPTAEEFKELSATKKSARMNSPEGREWPGTWDHFDSSLTRLTSWRNADGKIIRYHPRDPQGVRAFVHVGGNERWIESTPSEVHDQMVEYMAANPGDE